MARRTTAAIVGVGFQADTQKFTTGVKRTTKGMKDGRFAANRMRGSFNRLNKTITTTVARYASLGAAIAAVGGVAGFTSATRGALQFARQIDDLSRATGVGVQGAQNLARAIRGTKLQIDDIEDALTIAEERLIEFSRGEGTATDAFNQLGVAQRAANGQFRNGLELLQALAQAWQEYGESGRRNVALPSLTELFGDLGRRLVPVFERSGGDLASGGRNNLTQEQLNSLNELRDEFVGLRFNLSDTFNRLIAQNAESISEFISSLNEGIERIEDSLDKNFDSVLGGISTIIQTIGNVSLLIIERLDSIVTALLTAGGVTALVGGARLSERILPLRQLRRFVDGEQEFLTSINKFNQGVGEATKNLRTLSGLRLFGVVGFGIALADVVGELLGLGRVTSLIGSLFQGLARALGFGGVNKRLQQLNEASEVAVTAPVTETSPRTETLETEIGKLIEAIEKQTQSIREQNRLSLLTQEEQDRTQFIEGLLEPFLAQQEASNRAIISEAAAARDTAPDTVANLRAITEQFEGQRIAQAVDENRLRVGDVVEEVEDVTSGISEINRLLRIIGQSFVGGPLAVIRGTPGPTPSVDETGTGTDIVTAVEQTVRQQTGTVIRSVGQATEARLTREVQQILRNVPPEIQRRIDINRIVRIVNGDLEPLSIEQRELAQQIQDYDDELTRRYGLLQLRRQIELRVDGQESLIGFNRQIEDFIESLQDGLDDQQFQLQLNVGSNVERFVEANIRRLNAIIDARRTQLERNVEDAARAVDVAERAVALGLPGAQQELQDAGLVLFQTQIRLQDFTNSIADNRFRFQEAIEGMAEDVRQADIARQFAEIGEAIKSNLEGAFEAVLFESQSVGDAIKNLVQEIIKEIVRIAIIRPLVDNITQGLFSFGSRVGIPGLQQGGFAHPGFAVVGEAGPELVDFRRPARVYSNEDLAAALGSGGGTGSLTIIQNIESSDGPGVRSALAEATPQIIEAANGRIYNDLGDRNSSVSQLVRNRARE